MGKNNKKTEDFVHLHTHSDLSSLDGCGKIPDYVAEAKKRGNPAISFTDHGTMRGYFSQMESCNKAEVKPVYGIEFYIAENMKRKGLTAEEKAEITKGLKQGERKEAIRKYEDEHGIRDRWHLTVWAKDKVGLRNLFKLSSMGFLEGFYYKPRIDLETLIAHKEGLMASTGCLSSPINDRVAQGKERSAAEKAEQLFSAFGDDLWLEVQPHAILDQRRSNEFALKLQKEWGGSRLLATQDAHYIHSSDAQAHDVLLCIGTGSNLKDPDRFKFDGDEFHMRTRQEMHEAFKKHHDFMPEKAIKEALNNTVVLADRVASEILKPQWKAAILPPIDMPKEYQMTPDGQYLYLRQLCIDGWTWREIPERAERYAKANGISTRQAIEIYKSRLTMELRALRTQKFVPYFLLVRDLYKWVRKQDIMCGPGRGSAAGSIVSFLTGITSVDPIEHGLLFERFISPSRIDMPDIDMDFQDTRRGEIIQFLRDKYGHDKVAQIATVAKLSGKQCVAEGSMVMMADGNTKPVESVEPGEMVVCVDGNGVQTESKVVATMDNGEREVFEVLGEDGENLRLTGDHEVLTDRGWIRVDSLRISDNVIDLGQCLKYDATYAAEKSTFNQPRSKKSKKGQGYSSAPGPIIGSGEGERAEHTSQKSSKV